MVDIKPPQQISALPPMPMPVMPQPAPVRPGRPQPAPVRPMRPPQPAPQPAPVRPPIEAVEATMTVPTPGEVVTFGPGHSCQGHGYAKDPSNCRVYYR
jgi:hypothetical protein